MKVRKREYNGKSYSNSEPVVNPLEVHLVLGFWTSICAQPGPKAVWAAYYTGQEHPSDLSKKKLLGPEFLLLKQLLCLF